MMIFVTIMFLLPPVLVTLYLYVSGVFINRRAFQSVFYGLLVFFALIVGISMTIHYSYQGYASPATTPVSLSEVLPEPEQLCNTLAELPQKAVIPPLAEQRRVVNEWLVVGTFIEVPAC